MIPGACGRFAIVTFLIWIGTMAGVAVAQEQGAGSPPAQSQPPPAPPQPQSPPPEKNPAPPADKPAPEGKRPIGGGEGVSFSSDDGNYSIQLGAYGQFR